MDSKPSLSPRPIQHFSASSAFDFIRRNRFLLCVLAGMLFGLSWPPIGFWPFALVMPGILMLCLKDAERSTRFSLAVIFFSLAWSVAFHWNAMHPVTATAISSVVALFAMICIQAALIALFSSPRNNDVARDSAPDGPVRLHFLGPPYGLDLPHFPACIWGGLGIAAWDWMMMYGPMPMPGTMLGLSVSDSLIAFGWAPLVGSYALTLIVLLINGIWVAAILRKVSWAQAVVTILFLVAVPLIFNWLPNSHIPQQLSSVQTMSPRSSEPSSRNTALHRPPIESVSHSKAAIRQAPAETVAITSIQPAMSPEEWAEVENHSKIEVFEQLIAEALSSFPETDVVVLPETALPISHSDTLTSILGKWAKQFSVSIFAGGIERTDQNEFYNVFAGSSAYLNEQAASFIYRKRRLIPFVETIPFGDLLPFKEKFRLESGGVSSYEQGTELVPNTIRVRTTPLVQSTLSVGTLICFESFFPSDARQLKRKGANILVIPTQDGWWGSETARIQHAAYSRLIALGLGIPVVQSSVDGTTIMWDEKGKVLAHSSGNGLEFVHARFNLSNRKTGYSRMGDYPSNVFLALLLICYLVGVYKSRRFKANKPLSFGESSVSSEL